MAVADVQRNNTCLYNGGSMRIKKITGLMKSQREYKECYRIWKECFGDSDQYMEYYFTEKLRDNTIYMLEEDGQVVSMLHLNPYEMMVEGVKQTANYIVGVATLEEYRKRGYMGQLLRAAMKDMYDDGQLFTYLMPAAYAIYAPYDFRYVYEQRRFAMKIEKEESGELEAAQLTTPLFHSWVKLSKEEKEKAVVYANQLLEARFDVYPYRTVSYYDRLAVEMAAADGDLVVAISKDEIVGVLCYMSEEGNEGIEVAVVESLLAEEDTVLLYQQLQSQFASQGATIQLYESAFLQKEALGQVFGTVKEEEKPIIMARGIHVKKLLETMRAKEETSICIQVKDRYLEENNKTFEIHLNSEGCQVNEVESVAQLTMDMPEFIEWIFEKKRCFINDIV